MNTHLPFRYFVFYALFLLLLNGLFEHYHLYFFFWWLDVPMHFLSGMFVGLVTLRMLFSDHAFPHPSRPSYVLLIAAVSAFFVGVLWEITAPWFGHVVVPAQGGMVFDTIKDLINDVLGGLLAGGIFLKKGYNTTV